MTFRGVSGALHVSCRRGCFLGMAGANLFRSEKTGKGRAVRGPTPSHPQIDRQGRVEHAQESAHAVRLLSWPRKKPSGGTLLRLRPRPMAVHESGALRAMSRDSARRRRNRGPRQFGRRLALQRHRPTNTRPKLTTALPKQQQYPNGYAITHTVMRSGTRFLLSPRDPSS